MTGKTSYWTLIATFVMVLSGCGSAPKTTVDDLRATYLASSRGEHDHRITDWKTVAAWDFDDGILPETFHIFDGQWDVAEGRLRAVSGTPEHNRIIGLTNCLWPAFRLTFDAELKPRPEKAGLFGDIGIRLGADPDTASFAKSYVVILAHYANQASVIHRLNTPLARTEFTPIKPNTTHHITVEFIKPHIRVWVDGRVVIEAWERKGQSSRDHSDFLDLDPKTIIALHTWDTTMLIDNLKIEVPAQ